MADDNEQRRLDPEAAAAPNRDKRGESPIIEGEVAGGDEPPPAAAAEEPHASEPPKAEEPTPRSDLPPAGEAASPRRGPRQLVDVIIGGVAGAVIAAGALWMAGPSGDTRLQDRVAALEAPVADLTRRVTALESAAQSAQATADAAKTSQSDAQAARADAAKALALANKVAASADQRADSPAPATDLSAIDERLKKLENTPAAAPAAPAASPDLSSIEDRLAKIEAALAAPKNETRVAPDSAPPRGDWTSLAVAAEAVSARLTAGAPYPAEQAALERLGADPAKIAALKPFADKGPPTAASLATGFAKVSPDALKAAAPKETGGVMDRLMSNMGKVVKITPIGEIPGDDPAALVSQIAAALDRGDIGGAMALWARLPESARKASEEWAALAQTRLAADAAAQGVLNDAMAKLAAADKS